MRIISTAQSTKIAFIFGSLKGNVGDFAILDAMLRDSERSFPAAQRDVFLPSSRAVDAERLAAFRAAGAPDFNIVGATFQPDGSRHLLELLGLRRMAQNARIKALARQSREDAEVFRAYDAVFISGGDQWNGRALGRAMFGSLIAISEVNSALYAYPFSVNPRIVKFNSPAKLREMFGRIDAPLPLRDTLSRKMLAGFGLSVTDVPDCVFSLAEAARAVEPIEDRNPERIILSATEATNELRRAIGAIVEHSPVELLTTCVSEDGETWEALAAEFDIPLRKPLTWQEIVAEFSSARLVATNRLHGLILGSLADALLLPICDRKKSEAFALDTGTPCRVASTAVLSPEDISVCVDQRAAVMASVRGYRDRAAEKLARTSFGPSVLT